VKAALGPQICGGFVILQPVLAFTRHRSLYCTAPCHDSSPDSPPSIVPRPLDNNAPSTQRNHGEGSAALGLWCPTGFAAWHAWVCRGSPVLDPVQIQDGALRQAGAGGAHASVAVLPPTYKRTALALSHSLPGRPSTCLLQGARPWKSAGIKKFALPGSCTAHDVASRLSA
jgi:hypothetical protein